MSSEYQKSDEKAMDSFGNPNGVSETIKITNLNTDCLEIISGYLEFNDLLNMADSNKQFYDAVCRVYKRKYSNVNPLLDRKDRSHFIELELEEDALEKNPEIIIKSPILMLKLLRNFGHLIKNLAINFQSLNAKVCAGIENYLAEYCFDSLQRFSTVCNTSFITFENLRKPLNNVTALRIRTIIGQKQNHIQFLNENAFPKLQHVYIRNGSVLHDSEKEIHYENIEYITLRTLQGHKFPYSFGNLKHLTLVGCIDLNDALYEFINKNQHLKTLKIMSLHIENPYLFDKLLESKNIVTNIVEIQFEYNLRMRSRDVLRFLKRSKNLKKLSFHADEFRLANDYCSDFIQIISSNMGDEWKLYTKDPYRNPFSLCFAHKCYVIERIIIS